MPMEAVAAVRIPARIGAAMDRSGRFFVTPAPMPAYLISHIAEIISGGNSVRKNRKNATPGICSPNNTRYIKVLRGRTRM